MAGDRVAGNIAAGYVTSDGNVLSSTATVAGSDVSGDISGNSANVNNPISVENYGTGGPGWVDILGPFVPKTAGAGTPTFTSYGSGCLWGYKFALGDYGHANFHTGHDVKPGGDFYVHIHYFTNGTSTNTVKFEIVYTVAKGHQQGTDSVFGTTGTTTTVESTPSGTAYTHHIIEMPSPCTGPDLEPDMVISCKVTRVTNGGTNNTDDVVVAYIDIHCQADRVTTPNRAPDFYA